MIRTAVFAAAAAALFALTAPGQAQAAMANPTLNTAMPAAAEHVQYYYGPRRHRGYYYGPRHRGYYGYRPYRAYGYYPGYRRCVTVWNGWRYVRRCRW